MTQPVRRDAGFHFAIGGLIAGFAVVFCVTVCPRAIADVLMGIAGGMNIGVAMEYGRVKMLTGWKEKEPTTPPTST